MPIKIFTIAHKNFTPPPDSMYVPLHVGRANAEDLGFLGDDTGDSISHLNSSFCELTGMYWIWKNYHDADYIGICHYRRYLINENDFVYTEAELQKLLKDYDMITTKLLTLPMDYYDGFSTNHHSKDLDTTIEVVKEKYPEYSDTLLELVHGPHTYFGNIFITSREMYDRYCTWLFDILFEVQKRTDLTGYDGYQKRLFGFLSEFLQTVWIRYNNLSVYECKVGMVGAKYETETLKKQLAAFFEKGDYLAAKSCFLDTYGKRPDILMEASDISGELRLCMQIIATCEYEKEIYNQCLLDIHRKYSTLIEQCRLLNSVAYDYIKGNITKKELEHFRQNNLFTPIAIEIAINIQESKTAAHLR